MTNLALGALSPLQAEPLDLADCTVLLACSDFLAAAPLAAGIRERGGALRPAPSLPLAMTALRAGSVDAAIVSGRLLGEPADVLLRMLDAARIPHVEIAALIERGTDAWRHGLNPFEVHLILDTLARLSPLRVH